MLKRTWCLLLVLGLFAAPGAAFAAAPDRDAANPRDPSLLERVWDGILWLLDFDGGGERETIREADRPRSISAGDDGSGHVDPDG